MIDTAAKITSRANAGALAPTSLFAADKPEDAPSFSALLQQANVAGLQNAAGGYGQGALSRDADVANKLEGARQGTPTGNAAPPPRSHEAEPAAPPPTKYGPPAAAKTTNATAPSRGATKSGPTNAKAPAKAAAQDPQEAGDETGLPAEVAESETVVRQALAKGTDALPATSAGQGQEQAGATPNPFLATIDLSRMIANVRPETGATPRGGKEIGTIDDRRAGIAIALGIERSVDSKQAGPAQSTGRDVAPLDTGAHDITGPDAGFLAIAAAVTETVGTSLPAAVSAEKLGTRTDGVGALAGLAASAGAVGFADTPAPVDTPTSLPSPVGTALWREELGQAVIRLADNGQTEARLKLNPEHMGPIDILIDMSGAVANIQFTAEAGDTRQALEHSLGQLSQMMSDAGLSLGQANVGGESSTSSQTSGGDGSSAKRDADTPIEARRGEPAGIARRLAARPGGIDTFA